MSRSASDKLSGLEIVRFGAAFTVLVAHYCHFYIQGSEYHDWALERQPLYGLLEPFYHYGTRAVEVFWALSGFIFFHKYGPLIQRKAIPAARFFWLRFSRLYPLHLLTLVLVAVLQLVYHARYGQYYVVEINNLKHFVFNLLFVQYWGFQDGFSFNAPSWSVSVELLAYAFFFATTWYLGASLFTSVLVLGASAALNHFLGFEPVINRCIFYFYAGGLSCLVYRELLGRPALWRHGATAAGLAALFLCLRHFRATHDVDFVLNFAVPVALLVLALNSGLLDNAAGAIVDRLGNLTYASYLLHFPLQIAFMTAIGPLGPTAGFAASPLFLLAYLAVVFVAADFTYRKFEMPAQRAIRRRFARKAEPALGLAAKTRA